MTITLGLVVAVDYESATTEQEALETAVMFTQPAALADVQA